VSSGEPFKLLHIFSGTGTVPWTQLVIDKYFYSPCMLALESDKQDKNLEFQGRRQKWKLPVSVDKLA
jgi:hypothetical protein